ncbi:LysM peptidoglycan-binding domain-containing protein [Actinomyces bowdenii]|uniref:LysM peptidoglycan-binding domain-containing protein n=1 Tax=Actinomyces bowdenii TaxID=131109 RepID=UPI001FB8B565|nr:LysM peptidoglycan-binding domain-containing protein [Actinomyces bowdenii]
MSAIIAPPRPTRRLDSDRISPALPSAGSPAESSSHRPALRLVPGTGAQESAAPGGAGALPGPVPHPWGGSRPTRHLRLVATAAIGTIAGAGTGAVAEVRHAAAAPVPGDPRPSRSPAAPLPASAASPLTPAGATAPVHRAGPPRRPGPPLPLRERGPRPAGDGRSGARHRSAGQGATGIDSRPDQPRRTPATGLREGSRRAVAGSMAEAGRAARLAPNHPAVRSSRRRSQQGPALSARGARALPGCEQRRPPHSPAAQAPALPRPVRRFIAALGACLVAIAVISSGLALSGLVGTEPMRTTTTVVQPGQSLWEVASATGSPDVAQTVATIVELNDLDSPTIRAGETLTIPVH